jgi:hypothetical protein
MIWESAETRDGARKLIRRHPDDINVILRDFPSHFTEVFRTIVAN